MTDGAKDRKEPMLATLTEDRFSDPEWIFERKLDGVRCIAYRGKAGVRLTSRSGRLMNRTWPELIEPLNRARGTFVVDGEIVAFEGRRTSFSRLQDRIGIDDPDKARRSGVRVYLYLFDLLSLRGRDLTGKPLRERKGRLRKALDWSDPLRYTPHRNEHGERYLEEACSKGWEGLIAKRAAAPYHHGRSRDWLKFKCSNRQEFVIGGYTDPQGKREGFGALLLGYYRDDEFVYAGKVGTGFDDDTLRRMAGRMSGLDREACPFDSGSLREGGTHWIRPELVAEVAFTEWTDAGRLRHPRFLGLRTDKDARDVVRERGE